MRKRNEKGMFQDEHGGGKTKLYGVWCSMRERCRGLGGEKNRKNYYGKGITVCHEWDADFSVFRDWAFANGYAEGLTIDRIDNSGNYEPSNCRWVDKKTQNRNYSRNHMITYCGETKCLTDWADSFGLNRTTVSFRIRQGKPLDEVFSTFDGRSTRRGKERRLV